jgi:hypothetical protein
MTWMVILREPWENQDRQGRFEPMVLDTSENIIDAIVILASWYPTPRVDVFQRATRLINAGLGLLKPSTAVTEAGRKMFESEQG